MNHLLRNGDAHLKNFAILYDKDYTDASLAPIYEVVTTTVYNPKDIPALSLSGDKIWWKKKTGKLTCNIKPSRMEEIIEACIFAVKESKKEVIVYCEQHLDFKEFGEKLINEWKEEV